MHSTKQLHEPGSSLPAPGSCTRTHFQHHTPEAAEPQKEMISTRFEGLDVIRITMPLETSPRELRKAAMSACDAAARRVSQSQTLTRSRSAPTNGWFHRNTIGKFLPEQLKLCEREWGGGILGKAAIFGRVAQTAGRLRFLCVGTLDRASPVAVGHGRAAYHL